MAKYSKVIARIVEGSSDRNIAFEDLRSLLLHFGFAERTRGSHHIYRKAGIEEKLVLQRQGSNAKPYQVRQVRMILLKYHLAGED